VLNAIKPAERSLGCPLRRDYAVNVLAWFVETAASSEACRGQQLEAEGRSARVPMQACAATPTHLSFMAVDNTRVILHLAPLHLYSFSPLLPLFTTFRYPIVTVTHLQHPIMVPCVPQQLCLLYVLVIGILVMLPSSVQAQEYDPTPEYPPSGPPTWSPWTDIGCAPKAGATVPAFIEGYWTPGQYLAGFRVYYNTSGFVVPCPQNAVHGSSCGTSAVVCVPPSPDTNIQSATAHFDANGVWGITFIYENGMILTPHT
jgi:hypothetical protein